MFRSVPQDHLQGSSLVLSAYNIFASRFVICALHDQRALRQVQGVQIQTEGIQPHTSTNI
jgi:hypothetical protein